MDKILVKHQKKVTPIVAEAMELKIKDSDQMAVAVEVLSNLNKSMDAVKEEKEKVLKPLREAAKAEKRRWITLEDMYGQAVTRIRGLMSTYQTEAARKQKEEQIKIAARVGEGKGKLKAGTAIKKIGEIDAPEEKVSTASGSLSFRVKKQLKITSEKKIPKEYWVVDEEAVFKALKDGVEVEGAEIEEVQIPVNKR